MELDVHLKREGEESWGFRLIGGKDFGMPLTVVKVVPESPAAVAGLQNGDTVRSFNGADTADMAHDDAKQFVADAVELTLGVKRGLYDPVLNDYEPIYETIDQDDFDQPSQPTEVDPFKIQQFLDPNKTPERLSELRDIETPGFLPPGRNQTPGFQTPGFNQNGFDQSRSLTASPFVLPTKPYRPFSTEPLPIPPLEDPIILNPGYTDQFGKYDDSEFALLPETRFKLPISEQYDPNGTRNKRKESKRQEVRIEEDTKQTRKDVSVTEITCAQDLKQKAVEEKKFNETMKKEIDLDKIEMTAVSVVDESIERAVSVTDEIKKEIDVALRESSITSSKVEESKSVKESSKFTSETESVKEKLVTSTQGAKETNELVGLIDKTTNEIISYNGSKTEVSVAKAVQKFKSLDKKEQVVDERKSSTKQEIEETIEVGSVRRKSEAFDKVVETKASSEFTKKVKKETTKSQMTSEQDLKVQEQSKVLKEKEVQKEAFGKETVSKTSHKTAEVKKKATMSSKTSSTYSSDAKKSKQYSEQKAYKIGLQTIPNIKGTIHSSYHYNLLLKTFFLHLTDVMVALSRFILTEPVFNESEETQAAEDVMMKESVTEYKEKYVQEEALVKDKHVEQAELIQAIKETKPVVVSKKEEKIEVMEAKQELVDSKKEEKVLLREKAVEDQKKEITTKDVTQELTHAQVIEKGRVREDYQENLEVETIMDRKDKLSGAQMARIQERKSAELTQKMDAVITEFHNKAGLEDLEIARKRRSRSRSKVEEEVNLESDPLEWLSKHDQRKGTEISELKTESKSFSSSSESTETKRVERNRKIEKSCKSKEGKQMYVAIVESHVFTNKDAVFEEQAIDFSETSSVQSADEINIGLQTTEVVATEKLALKTEEIKQEIAETVLEESRDLNIVYTQAEAILQVAEEKQSATIVEETEAIIEEVKDEKVFQVETKAMHDVVIQEIIEPVVEIQEMKTAKITEEYQKLSVKDEEHIMTVSEKTEISVAETHETKDVQEIKQEEYAVVSTVETQAIEVVKEEPKQIVPPVETELSVVQRARSHTPVFQEESVALTIVKPASTPTEKEKTFLISEESELSVNKHMEILETGSQYNEMQTTKLEGYESKQIVQEASFTAKSLEQIEQESTFTAKYSNQTESESQGSSYQAKSEHKQLTLQMNLSENGRLETSSSVSSIKSTIDTPTPSTVPPTPLTDEYVFKLKAPMPKNKETIPRDCTPTPPSEEDPNIVKKKLTPYIETTLESPIIYDPPLPTPPEDKVSSPVYTKPGLKGGSNKQDFRKEEILEIGRKSTLLASAIDETIKSIEEYKEEVGIDTKKDFEIDETAIIYKTSSKTAEEHTTANQEITNNSTESQPIIYNGYANMETRVFDIVENNHIDEEWNKIDEQVKSSNEELTELSNNVDVEVNVTLKVNDETKAEVEQRFNTLPKQVEQDETKRQSIETVEFFTTFNEENKVEEATAEFTIKSDNMFPANGRDQSTLIKQTNGFLEETISEVNLKLNESEKIVNNFENGERKPKAVTMNGFKDNYEDVTKKPEMAAMNGFKTEVGSSMFVVEEKKDPIEGYRPIQFNPEELQATKKGLQSIHLRVQPVMQRAQSPSYVDSKGELLGTRQGIVDGLEDAVVIQEAARELGKPGMTEQKIAELISGESEMLREAHVMGLSRVLKSHMHRADDDSSVDFQKIKPILESLKNSEVLKALNEEIARQREEKRKEEEKKWTTFLQKPKRPVPKAKFGYPGFVEEEEIPEVPYKVKIVKQPKPKVAPDYKPENFETGPLPWEERAQNEPPPPPVAAEDPILVPEELPEFLEAVDPLPESEVPDLEETGIPLPPPKPIEESTPSPAPEEPEDQDLEEQEAEELDLEAVVEETQQVVAEMEQNRLAEQLLSGVQSMVDPNASIDQQLAQMRAQLAALAQLPCVIQQTLDLVTKQLSHLTQQETQQITTVAKMETHSEMTSEEHEYTEETQTNGEGIEEETQENSMENMTNGDETEKMTIVEVEDTKPSITQEELEKLKKEEEEMLEEQWRVEKQKKELMDQMQLEQESRQLKQRPTPRVGKPKPVFGPPEPVDRPLVLPGGRRWRKPEDAYNEAFIAETLSAQAELIQGKAYGFSYESEKLPYDERINFMKYEKPPVSLDHLQQSETYKLIHNMEQSPAKRVELRTPVIAEADYREKCRSVTPSNMASRLSIPQQVEP